MISENTLAKVRNLPIQRILEPYVKFKREGGHTLKGLCPFHSERTPSFAVNLSKNLYHCFGCNRGGDGITFIMEKENLNFLDAVRFIAKQHNITIEYTKDGETTEEEKTEQKRKESLLAALDILQNFFVNNLRLAGSDETRHAQDYAYGRWPEEFCSEAGIGYAPKDGKAFMDFCRQKGIQEDLLFELGMFKRAEDNDVYPMFRERIMIPVRNRWGRIIAYTARYIGTNPKAPKYINSATSLIYTKGETLFGIDRAFQLRNPENIIIVEGAPDVLRMQSIGLENTVASLGTAWNENQLELLKRHTDSLCFIPDSDVSEDGLPGAGFKAAMENGALAIRKGFHVTVRELPLGSRELTEEESQKMYEGQAIPPEALREIPMKNDADSYIQDEATYRNLREKHFIVWNVHMVAHGHHVGPSLGIDGKAEVIQRGILCHEHHAVHLVANLIQVGVDGVGQRHALVAVEHVVAVALLLCSTFPLKRIGYLGIVHDVYEVTYQLLCFHHQPSEFRQAVELVGELGLADRFNQFRYVPDDVEGTAADFLVVQALRAEAGDVLHRQLVEFLHRGHADRIEFHLLLLGGDGVQPSIVLFLDEFLGGKVGRHDFDAVLVNDYTPAGK